MWALTLAGVRRSTVYIIRLLKKNKRLCTLFQMFATMFKLGEISHFTQDGGLFHLVTCRVTSGGISADASRTEGENQQT